MAANIIPYGPASSVESMANTARQALAKHGHRVIATWDLEDPDGEPAVWVIPADQRTGEGEYFRPGQQLVVEADGSYEILPVSAVAPTGGKRTPEAWCAEYGVLIIDPDGWRSRDAPSWDTPITLADFYDRAVQCTIRNVVSVDWQRIARDAKAATP